MPAASITIAKMATRSFPVLFVFSIAIIATLCPFDINGVKNDEIQLYQMSLLVESASRAAKTIGMSGVGK